MSNNEYAYDMKLSEILQEDYTKSESDKKIQDNLIDELDDLKDDAIAFGVKYENK